MITTKQAKWWRATTPLVLLAGLSLAGCGNSPTTTTAPSAPTVDVQIKAKHFALEIAATQAQREHGLMERTSMPADHGMIFLFAKPEVLTFWMKNTILPLDLVYLDEHGKVIDILPLVPKDLSRVTSSGPALYAIELNRDAAAAADLHPGDSIELPKNLPTPEGDPP